MKQEDRSMLETENLLSHGYLEGTVYERMSTYSSDCERIYCLGQCWEADSKTLHIDWWLFPFSSGLIWLPAIDSLFLHSHKLRSHSILQWPFTERPVPYIFQCNHRLRAIPHLFHCYLELPQAAYQVSVLLRNISFLLDHPRLLTSALYGVIHECQATITPLSRYGPNHPAINDYARSPHAPLSYNKTKLNKLHNIQQPFILKHILTPLDLSLSPQISRRSLCFI